MDNAGDRKTANSTAAIADILLQKSGYPPDNLKLIWCIFTTILQFAMWTDAEA